MIAALVLAVALPAAASLGGDVTTVQADQAQMKASRRVTQAAAYTVHEMQSSGGSLVREYVSPAGKVFAVTWQTVGHPDMQQLLGSYYEQFQHAAPPQVGATRRARRAPVAIQTPGLVVEIGGVPRHIVGRAYDPQMLPENVSTADIR
jgi:hypothetical protein